MRIDVSSALKNLSSCEQLPETRRGFLDTRHISNKTIMETVRVFDMIVVFACSLIAKILYVDIIGGAQMIESSYMLVGFSGALLSLITLNQAGIYAPDNILRGKPSFRHAACVFKSLSYAFMLIVFLGYAFKTAELYSRGWTFLWFALSFVAITGARFVLMHFLKKLANDGYFRTRTALYGLGPQNMALRHAIQAGEMELTSLSGLYEDDSQAIEDHDSTLIAGGLDELIQDGMQNKFDRIIIGIPAKRTSETTELLAAMSILPVNIQICPENMPFSSLKPEISYIGNHTLFDVGKKPISEWQGIAKAILDQTLGLILLVLLSPLMALIALAIRLDSPGPILFFQKRHGYNHRTINVCKFRTMTVQENDNNVRQATKDDDRVTRVGKFLRRTSLDELPQLFNVINAEMSLVGPRPHALVHNNYYSALLEKYPGRHKVKPGMTGLAQIRGLRGETDTLEKMRERADVDIEYIENWSFAMDIKILFKTPLALLHQKNAY
ncbi:MAG: undecaprenyl-phosphate glucose phosphotransferase [Hyphomicrobiaceae bacterium]|nr:undecaprenyl-phosphate glucose phosphotransferase [Hyphomicrobiaceae bacterium]